MKTTLTLALASVATGAVAALFAQAGGSEFGAFEPWVNIGATGCLILLLVWVVTKQYPALAREHREAFAELQKAGGETLDRMADRFERREERRDAAVKQLTDDISQLRANCAAWQAKSTGHDEHG
jgi:hypothetical protein